MKTIVVATDFSPSAENAASYAAQIAKKIGASVLLVHAYQIPVSMNEVPVMILPIEELKTAANNALLRAKERFMKNYADVEVTTESRLGDVVDEINDVCNNLDVFAIVIGKHGVNGIEKFIAGSTTLVIVRHCALPVIAVSLSNKNETIKKIAFATDFAHTGDLPLQKISAIVQELGALLHIIHVREKKENTGADLLKNLLTDLSPTYHIIDDADFFHGIQSYVHQNNIDLLITIPHKHSLLERLFSKTHTTELVEELDVPIMSICE